MFPCGTKNGLSMASLWRTIALAPFSVEKCRGFAVAWMFIRSWSELNHCLIIPAGSLRKLFSQPHWWTMMSLTIMNNDTPAWLRWCFHTEHTDGLFNHNVLVSVWLVDSYAVLSVCRERSYVYILSRYCKHFLGRTTRWVCMPMVFVFAVLTADEQEPRVDLVRMCLSTAQRRLSCLFEDLFLRFEPEFLCCVWTGSDTNKEKRCVFACVCMLFLAQCEVFSQAEKNLRSSFLDSPSLWVFHMLL